MAFRPAAHGTCNVGERGCARSPRQNEILEWREIGVESVQGLFQGTQGSWAGLTRTLTCPLPIPSATMLVPANLKITAPEANLGKLKEYMTRVLERAAQTSTKPLVFGSGGARNVPDEFDPAQA